MRYLFRGCNRVSGEVMEGFAVNKNAARALFIEFSGYEDGWSCEDIVEVHTPEGYRISRLRDLRRGDIFWCVKPAARADGFVGTEPRVFGKALVRAEYVRTGGCDKYEVYYWDDINHTKYLRGNAWVTTDVTF